jgi:hypothetical protein
MTHHRQIGGASSSKILLPENQSDDARNRSMAELCEAYGNLEEPNESTTAELNSRITA